MVCECIVNGKWGWTPEKLVSMGLTQTDDGSGSPWGTSWELKTSGFFVWVDPCGVVKLSRTDSDPITVHIDSMRDFETLLDMVREV